MIPSFFVMYIKNSLRIAFAIFSASPFSNMTPIIANSTRRWPLVATSGFKHPSTTMMRTKTKKIIAQESDFSPWIVFSPKIVYHEFGASSQVSDVYWSQFKFYIYLRPVSIRNPTQQFSNTFEIDYPKYFLLKSSLFQNQKFSISQCMQFLKIEI